MDKRKLSKTELFGEAPVGKALLTMAIPTVISQLINLIYNVVDAFFIGRTGNPYMMAATTITLTMFMINVSLSNLFGIGGGSHVSRLMGKGEIQRARSVSAFGIWGAGCAALLYSLLTGLFLQPLLRFLGASDATLGYARSYAFIVVVLGSLPCMLSLTTAHLLRSAGYSTQASLGLSGGGILNVLLDPLFMFVLMPKGQEVTGAALAPLLSNTASAVYLLFAYRKAGREAPLRLRPGEALRIAGEDRKAVFAVGVPSAVLTGLFDVANICVNRIAATHDDLVLAAMGIVMKVERIPNAANVGLCQGMLPIVAFNYAAGNHERMRKVISTARKAGLLIAAGCIVFFECFAGPASRMFLSTSAGDAQTALLTVGYAALFLRIRAAGSPVQFLNYHASFCMQAMGRGKETLLHAFVREIVFYIPFMFLLDRLFGQVGLAAALPIGEGCGAVFAAWLLRRSVRLAGEEKQA